MRMTFRRRGDQTRRLPRPTDEEIALEIQRAFRCGYAAGERAGFAAGELEGYVMGLEDATRAWTRTSRQVH